MPTITNNGKSAQGLRANGRLVWIAPGASEDIELTDKELDRAKAIGKLTVGGGSEPVDRDAEDRFSGLTDDELREYLEEQTGEKPHWNSKRETLLEKARAL